MSPPKVVAIDGAAGSGKSTLARSLASRLGLAYVNTGLMYRALAALALRRGIQPHDGPRLARAFGDLSFSLASGSPAELQVEGYDDDELSSPEVEGCVSAVASHPEVRELMRGVQRELGERSGAVMEGRDIGSTVFPDAPVKLYLTAPGLVREHRRAGDRPELDRARVADSLRDRDDLDSATNAFVPPPGAVVIDTGDLTAGQTLDIAIAEVERRMPELSDRR
jgi:cytidylate kinase